MNTNLRKKLIKDCDSLVAQIVKKRDVACVICFPNPPKSPVQECGHLFSRRFMSTRWDLTNCNVQCQYHNSLHRFDEYPYTKWFIEHYGKETWDNLYLKRKQTKSWKVWELQELKDNLQEMLLGKKELPF